MGERLFLNEVIFQKKKADLLYDKVWHVFKNNAFRNLFSLHKLVGEGRWRQEVPPC